jgi:hypothetical protein
MADKFNINKVFSGYQPCYFVKNHRRFRDHPCPHHQDIIAMMMGQMVPETSVTFNELIWWIAREYFNNVCRLESIT